MTVLGRGLVFQPVLVTHTCTYSNNNIITLQNIDITDFPSNKQTNKQTKNPTPPPLPQTHNYNNNKKILADVLTLTLKLSKLHIKKKTRIKIK